jgi:hypothetical protein
VSTAGPLAVASNALPATLRDELLGAFNQIVKNFRERRWEPSELNGGKFCEVVYTILKGYADGAYPTRARKPRNMLRACQNLESEAAGSPRSIRIQIPRMLIALYEIRNNRNVGHVGGDVDPNHMDAVCVLQMSKWIMAELVRVLHGVTTDEAPAIVDGLVERDAPLIWEVDGKKRVLRTDIGMRDKTLLLLHATSGPGRGVRPRVVAGALERERLPARRPPQTAPGTSHRVRRPDGRPSLARGARLSA